MAGPTTAALDYAADAVASEAAEVSLHTGDPGTSGASEVSGGSYARQTPSYAASSGGTADLASSVTFNVPGGVTVSHYGLWDGGGAFLGGEALTTPREFASGGTYELTSAPVNG